MESCIYEGQVRHARTRPAKHQFNYRLFMMYLDLDELDTLFQKRWFWSHHGRRLRGFGAAITSGQKISRWPMQFGIWLRGKPAVGPPGRFRLLTNLSLLRLLL